MRIRGKYPLGSTLSPTPRGDWDLFLFVFFNFVCYGFVSVLSVPFFSISFQWCSMHVSFPLDLLRVGLRVFM